MLQCQHLDIIFCLKLAVLLPDLVQGLVVNQVSSCRSTIEFGQYVLHFAPSEDYLSYFGMSNSRLPVAFQYVIPYCKGPPLGPVALVGEAAVINVLLFQTQPSHHFQQNRSHVVVIQLLPPKGI